MTVYDRNIFKQFFDVDDPDVLAWRDNVFNKLYGKGLIPDYITRVGDITNPSTDDQDFIDFFTSITHLFAIIVRYGRLFGDIQGTEKLLLKYIHNLGLFVRHDESYDHLVYLFENFPDEFKKRGTLDIVEYLNDTTIPDGELLRLINYTYPDEFIFALLESSVTGWCIGHSSPTLNTTRDSINMIKGYEKCEGFEDLSVYPTQGDVVLFPKDGVDRNAIVAYVDPGFAENGIYVTPLDSSTWGGGINIDSSLCYEIVLRVEQGDNTDTLNFGCEFLDDTDYITTEPTRFFTNKHLYKAGQEYFINGILFDADTYERLNFDGVDMTLDVGFGEHLRIPPDTLYIKPVVYTTSIDGSDMVIIYDFKLGRY